MKLAWLTDLHLNFLKASARKAFIRQVADARPDAVLLGGDIDETHSDTYLLETLARMLGRLGKALEWLAAHRCAHRLELGQNDDLERHPSSGTSQPQGLPESSAHPRKGPTGARSPLAAPPDPAMDGTFAPIPSRVNIQRRSPLSFGVLARYPLVTGYAAGAATGKDPQGVYPAIGGILGVLLGSVSDGRGGPFPGG